MNWDEHFDPTATVELWLPPGRGLSYARVPRAVWNYVKQLETVANDWRERVERNRELRIEAEARAGRLARDARR